MNNDTLINQARSLYAALEVEQNECAFKNEKRFARLARITMLARIRYQRRLNHCVVCSGTRDCECLQACFRHDRQSPLCDVEHPHALCSD